MSKKYVVTHVPFDRDSINNTLYIDEVGPSGKPANTVAEIYPLETDDEELVLANLFAASPELLDAAVAARALIRGSGFTDNTKALILLNAAIAKAQGENK